MQKLLLILILFLCYNISLDCQTKDEKIANKTEVIQSLNSEQFYFLENKGQWDDKVLFMAQSKSLRTWITKNSIVFEQFEKRNPEDFRQRDTSAPKPIKAHAVGLEFMNPSPVNAKKGEAGPTKFNFIIGNDKSKHKSGVLQYSDVSIENIYEGIDMRYYFDNGELRYDFIVKPGANPDLIEMEIKGSENFYIKDGDVVMETSLEPVTQKGLNAYQDKKQKKVDCKFKINGNKLKFELGEYDKGKELVIDPLTVACSFWLPWFRENKIFDIDLNQDGWMYCLGYTNSPLYPTPSERPYAGNYDLYIFRAIDIDCQVVFDEYFTYFGGSNHDLGTNIKIYNNRIYIGGYTHSNNIPLTETAYFDGYINDWEESFFAILDITGEDLLYSTYVGNVGFELINSMKVSSGGEVYIAGGHNNSSEPFTPLKQILNQEQTWPLQGFISAFTPTLTLNGELTFNLKFATLFGGDYWTEILDIDLDEDNNIFICGITNCSDYSFKPTENAFDVENQEGKETSFISKLHLDNDIGHLVIDYNSFFGNKPVDVGNSIIFAKNILWRDNKIIFSGNVDREYLIPLKNSFDSEHESIYNTEAFLTAIEPNSNGINDLYYSSYFGDIESSDFFGMDYDETCDKVILCGETFSKLKGFSYPINNDYNPSSAPNTMVCVVDVNLSGLNSLRELAYIRDRKMYAIKIKPGTNNIFTGGYDFNNNDFAMNRLTKEDCTDGCPCSDDRNDMNNPWLVLTSTENSQNCEPGQCYVAHTLNLPETIHCYTHYDVNDGSGWTDKEQIPVNGQLNYINRCVNEGTELNITVRLYEGYNDPIPCDITNSIVCGCVCPESKNDWLILSSIEGTSDCDIPQCSIRSELYIPSQYSCYPYYYIDDGSGITIILDTPGYGDNIDVIDRCLPAGSELNITLYLLEYENDPNPCIITKSISCPCKCPDDVDSWLTINKEPAGEGCAEDECKITYDWNIPPGYDCFTHYSDDGINIHIKTPNPELNLPDCVPADVEIPFNVALMRGPNDQDPCYINKDLICDIDESVLPCYRNCFNNHWEKGLDLPPIELDCNGCSIVIEYWTRIACPELWGGFQEIQITKIKKYNRDGFPVENCDGCTDEEVYIKAVKSVIGFNLMNFKPLTEYDPCVYTYRIAQHSCWTKWVKFIYDEQTHELIRKVTIYIPCNSDCCLRQMKICRKGDYNVEMTDLGLLTDYVDCEGLNYIPPAPYPPVDCEYTCDVLENYDDSGLGKIHEIKPDIHNYDIDNLENTIHFEINVSQNDNILTVHVQESNAKNIMISLYNINGQLIINKEGLLTIGLNQFDIDLISLTSGSYLYNIIIDGILVEKDKLIIIK